MVPASATVAPCAQPVYSQPMDKDVFPTPPDSGHANLLEHAASSYLRSARHQPVRWHPWGEAAFRRAQAEDKPILLDIGAVWCHWCHVMDRESYENPQIAALINEHYVAVKVDRDERPDVDARYQAAVAAITGQGGWPLTAFLTPDGRPYFGGAYIPPDDRYGRPGFGRVLTTLAQVWREHRDEALETAAGAMAAIEHNESFSGGAGQLSQELVDKIAASILHQFDPRNGGFGGQPKFPHPGAMDLLLHVGIHRNQEQSSKQTAAKLDASSDLCQGTTLQAAAKLDDSSVLYQGTTLKLAEKCQRGRKKRQGTTSVVPQMHQNKSGALAPEVQAFATTLEHMARGGVYDQLAGGFHRYSVDERWRVPHFEKMLYDNTELLRNYLHGYQCLGREDFRRIAEEIASWLLSTMSDSERGGFYASQDADINLDDDGDYFTWTLAEARLTLLAAKFSLDDVDLALRYWDIGELGDMRHDPARNVLHLTQTIDEMALESGLSPGMSVDELRLLLDSARRTLLAARARRSTPFIDRTLYTGWNAMAVSACLETARVLGMNTLRDFALLSLNRLLREAWDGGQTLRHVIVYGEIQGDLSHSSELLPEKNEQDAAMKHRAPSFRLISGERVGDREAQSATFTAREGAKQPDKIHSTLDDYAFTIHACIDAWLVSGEMSYYHAAVKLADSLIALFHDPVGGAFYDTAAPPANAPPLGALAARRKPLQDSPTPAGNPTAASALLRLEILSGRAEYRQIAEQTLASFAGVVEHLGLYAGSYGLALERLLLDPVQVVVIGPGADAEKMEATALSRFAVNKTVLRIAPERLVPGGIPPALAETLLHAPKPDGAQAWAIVCRGHTCLPPITSTDALREALL